MQAQTSSKSVLRVMNGSGDTRVTWDRERLAAGDPEAQAAVREAERIFDGARARGGQAFEVVADGPVRRLDHFDPELKEVLVIPAMVGG